MRILASLLLLLAVPCGAAVNVNSATYTELLGLPGIGPKLAQAILDDYAVHGAFKSAADLERVKGIGPATSARLAPLLEFGELSEQPASIPPASQPPRSHPPKSRTPGGRPLVGATRRLAGVKRPGRAPDGTAEPKEPLDLNTADADSLGRLPGLGEKLANRIVEFRAAHGPFRSVAALGKVKGVGPRRAAALARLVKVK